VGSFYSLSNINYDRANSTLNGTNLNREFNFDNIRANFLNGISNTVFQYISGLSSNAQTQLDNKQAANTNLTQLSSLTTSGNKYKVIRLNGSENGVTYDLALPALTTTERNNLPTPSINFIIYNSTDDKLQKYTGTGWVNLVAAGTGNVSVNSLTGISNGELALFSSADGTTLTKIDGTTSQRRVLSKNSKLIAGFTTAERDAIIDFANGDIIYNLTNNFVESYNGTTWIQNYRDTTDFVNWIANGVNAGGSLVGNAQWKTDLVAGSKNGVLLTPALNSQKGLWYKAIPQIAHKRIVLTADHVAGGGNGADGIFYGIFANAIPTTSTILTTTNNSYSIFFDEFSDEVRLYYNGTLLQTTPFAGLDSSATDCKQIRIVIDYNPFTDRSRIFAEIKGAGLGVGVCIDYNDTVARNLTGQYVFACAFTGGSNNIHELHNLAIRKFYEY
jgi:hypothetical protein